MDPNLPPGIQSVERNGDFQTIRFIDGSYVWCDSEQSTDGEWIDGRGIDAVLALADAAATPQGVVLTPEERHVIADALENDLDFWPEDQQAWRRALVARLEKES